MTDERAGLVSASNFEIVAMCPGQPALKDKLPDNVIDLPDELAEMGSRIHKARETKDSSELNSEEREIFERGVANEGRIYQQWVDDFSVGAYVEKRELRLWLHWPDMTPATSAKLDVHYVSATHILIVEWKTLWCHTLTPAERNYQGRVQAVCAAKEYGASHVRVAFNKAMFGKSDIVDYNETDLKYAENSIFQKLWEAQRPEAQRNPGPWCNYCPCKPICREAAAYSLVPAKLGENPVEMVQVLPIEDLATIHRKALVIGKVLDAVKARLKAFPAQDLQRVGLKIGNGKKLDPVTNIGGAVQALLKAGITRETIWAGLDITKGALVDAIRTEKGWTKKQTEEWLWTETLKQFITPKTSNGSLEDL